jgi:hypothetical protein
MNDETRDQALSRLYREGAWPEPSRQIDQAIIAASRRAARERHPFLWRFAPPFAIAATVVLTSAIVLKVVREQPAALEYSTAPEKTAAATRANVAETKPKDAEKAAAPAAPATEPQAPATPQGFSTTMDTAEALRLERAQRDIGFKEPSPVGATATKVAPAAKAAPQALKKESTEPPAANRELRADSPQATRGTTFSVFGASPSAAQTPPPAQAQAPAAAPAARAAKPVQQLGQIAPQAAPRPETTVQAAPRETAPTPPSAVDLSAAARSPVAGVGTNALAVRVDKAERTPQAWIDDIRKMMKEGKSEEAGEEIAKFKKRYPDYVLPEDLR